MYFKMKLIRTKSSHFVSISITIVQLQFAEGAEESQAQSDSSSISINGGYDTNDVPPVMMYTTEYLGCIVPSGTGGF